MLFEFQRLEAMENQYNQSASPEPRQNQEQYLNKALPAEFRDIQKQQETSSGESVQVCFHCKHPISATADICENCSTWLLIGQCCFCYTPVELNQKFCAECGNPPMGIQCISCGTHSIFDYCPNCHNGLTEQAEETVIFIQQSAEFQEVLQLQANVQDLFEKGATQVQIDTEQKKLMQRIEEWNEFYQKSQQQRQQQHSTRQNPTGGTISSFNLDAAQANSQQLATEQQRIAAQAIAAREQLLQVEAENIKRITAIQQKMFADHQSARRYHDSLKLLIPTLVPKTIKVKRIIGWLCVWANVLHRDGPCACGNPALGGSWQYETDEIPDGNFILI